MRGITLSFVFVAEPSYADSSLGERASTRLVLPLIANQHENLREQILTIANSVAYFTQFSLFVHCPDLNLYHHPIALREPAHSHHLVNAVCLAFDVFGRNSRRKTYLYFYAPIRSPFALANTFLSFKHPYASADEQEYASHVRAFVDPLLKLLNTDVEDWTFIGFAPQYRHVQQAKRFNKLSAKQRKKRKTNNHK